MRASTDGLLPRSHSPGAARPLNRSHTTVVEITATLSEEGADAIHDAVHRGIDALHRADLATVITTGEARRAVGPADVWPVIPSLRRSSSQPSDASPRVIVLGEGKPPAAEQAEALDQAAVPTVTAALGAIEAGDPTARWREWRAAAMASQRAVRPAEAAVQLCVAVEVLVDAARGLALYESGTSPQRAAAALRESPAVKIVEGFDLEPRGWRVVAVLRAAVLQRGHLPTPEELIEAFRAADDLRQQILDRTLERGAELPITASLLAGGRRSPQDARGWLDGYVSWRASIDAAGGGWGARS